MNCSHRRFVGLCWDFKNSYLGTLKCGKSGAHSYNSRLVTEF